MPLGELDEPLRRFGGVKPGGNLAESLRTRGGIASSFGISAVLSGMHETQMTGAARKGRPWHSSYYTYLRGDPKGGAPRGQHRTAPNAHPAGPWPMGLGWGVGGDSLSATFMPRLCVYGR